MKKIMLGLCLTIVGIIYFVPIIIIVILAFLCMGICEDLTSTRPVIWFIYPIRYLENKIFLENIKNK